MEIKRSILILLSLVSFLACTKIGQDDGYGMFELDLSVDMQIDEAVRSTALDQADFSDYNVSLYREGQMLWKTTYDVLMTDKSYNRVPAGNYTIEVESCTEAEAETGYGRMRLVGSEEFSVVAGRTSSPSVLCEMANARVTLAYDDTFISYFEFPGASVTNGVRKLAVPELTGEHSLEKAFYYNVSSEGSMDIVFTVTAGVITTQEIFSYEVACEVKGGRWNKIDLKLKND